MKVPAYLLLPIFLIACTRIPGDSSAALVKILKKDLAWQSVEADGVSMHYPAESVVSHVKDETLAQLQRSCKKAEQFMQMDYPGAVHFVIVDDNKTVQFLTGTYTNGTAYPYSDCVVQIAGVSSSSHEVFHLMSINSWGMPKHWISEGMAVYCDGNWWGYDLHALSKHLYDHNKLPLFAQLTGTDKTFRSLNSSISYPVAGSISRFIEEQYGRAALLELWKSNDPYSALGKDWLGIESEWKEHIIAQNADHIHYIQDLDL